METFQTSFLAIKPLSFAALFSHSHSLFLSLSFASYSVFFSLLIFCSLFLSPFFVGARCSQTICTEMFVSMELSNLGKMAKFMKTFGDVQQHWIFSYHTNELFNFPS